MKKDSNIISGNYILFENLYIPFNLILPTNIEKNSRLLIYIHGKNECGSDGEKHLVFPLGLKNKYSINSYILCPQFPLNGFITEDVFTNNILELINYICEKYNIDKNYINIFGFSLGGFRIHNLINKNPYFFNKAVIISGRSNNNLYNNIFSYDKKLTSVWLIHGDKDKTVSVDHSRSIFPILKEKKMLYKYSEIENVNHFNIITKLPNYMDWLLD